MSFLFSKFPDEGAGFQWVRSQVEGPVKGQGAPNFISFYPAPSGDGHQFFSSSVLQFFSSASNFKLHYFYPPSR